MRIATVFLCSLIGHDRRYRTTQYFGRGRWRTGNDASSARCGSHDSEELHRPGAIEYLTGWRFHLASILRPIRQWCFASCIDCDKPCRRLGREIGDHHDCIPF
jgi:hypothetical protein